MSDTRLSVIMANYNHGHFLEERISSILSQMSPLDEFIVVDDASTDHSLSILEKFALQDSRFKFLKNEQNVGAVSSINRALNSAQGTYITGLSADDALLPGFIEKTMTLLMEHPEIGICCSDCARSYAGILQKPSDRIYTDRLIENIERPTIFSQQIIIQTFWTTYFWIPGHTAIMKRDLALKYGGFKEGLGPFCDWFLMHTIALNAGAGYIPEELSVWRIDQKGYSSQMEADQEQKKIFQMNIFHLLNQQEFKSLRDLFKRSGLLHYHIRQNIRHLSLKPHYWHFFIPFIHRYFALRWNKYAKS